MWNESDGQIANLSPLLTQSSCLHQRILSGITLSLAPSRMGPIFVHTVVAASKQLVLKDQLWNLMMLESKAVIRIMGSGW